MFWKNTRCFQGWREVQIFTTVDARVERLTGGNDNW